jgi:short-subunit dehydrogenase
MQKVALVTGASSGIGEAIALKLAGMGITTYAAARRLSKMDNLKEKGIRTLHLDLTDETSIDQCLAQIKSDGNEIDILINNAGTASMGAIEDVPLKQAREQFEVNFFGMATLIQRVLPSMRTRRSGHIINVSSVGGVMAMPFGGWFHASKFAVEAYTTSLRQEVNPFGVKVTILRPGAIAAGWRDVADQTLEENSGKGAYAPSTKKMGAKFSSPDFQKKLSPPSVIADVLEQIVKSEHPDPVYTAPSLAKNLVKFHVLMASDNLRDGFNRTFLGLPKTM